MSFTLAPWPSQAFSPFFFAQYPKTKGAFPLVRTPLITSFHFLCTFVWCLKVVESEENGDKANDTEEEKGEKSSNVMGSVTIELTSDLKSKRM